MRRIHVTMDLDPDEICDHEVLASLIGNAYDLSDLKITEEDPEVCTCKFMIPVCEAVKDHRRRMAEEGIQL